MQAVRFPHPGDPSVLRVEEVPDPAPPRGDRLLLRVAASSVNGTDLGIRGRGAPAVFGRVVGLGFDVVGEVEACGPAVTAFAPGDRVAALLPHSGGGQAEQVVLRQGRAARVPDGVATTDAAAVPLAGLTALQALYQVAGLRGRPGARVLVYGASGGIGSFAVQLARLAGAGEVTGTASPGKREHVLGLGAGEVLGHDEALRAGRTYDVVFDTPGRLAMDAARPVLAARGVLVTTRVVSAANGRALIGSALRRPLRRSGRGDTAPRFAFVATSARSADLAHLLELVRTGRLRVPVDRVLPLADIAAAHRRAEARDVAGKVVVTVP